MKRLEELFEIIKTQSEDLINFQTSNKSLIPYISRTSINNGVSAFVDFNSKIKINNKNLITVSLGGMGVMYSFYQNNDFYIGQNVAILSSKENLNLNEILYYCECLKKNNQKYSYGRGANRTLKDIMLPERHELPSWVYTKKIPTVSIKKPEKLTFDLSTWKEFLLTDLFDVKRGDVNSVSDLEKGDIPVVTATENNNGISFHTDNKSNYKTYENCLTITNDGGVGNVFYQKNIFIANPSVTILILKDKEMNRHYGLFLKTIIEHQKKLFNYGRKLNDSRLKRMKIKLPVIKETQEIDWDYIEEIIKKFDNIQIS